MKLNFQRNITLFVHIQSSYNSQVYRANERVPDSKLDILVHRASVFPKEGVEKSRALDLIDFSDRNVRIKMYSI